MRKTQFSTLTDLNPGFGGPWDMLGIFFVNVIFIMLHRSLSVKKNFEFHRRVQKCHFGNFSLLAKWQNGGWVSCCTHPKVITGNGQLTRSVFIIIDFLRNLHFSRNRISGEFLISGRYSTKSATVLSAAFESTADFLVTFALSELYVCERHP